MIHYLLGKLSGLFKPNERVLREWFKKADDDLRRQMDVLDQLGDRPEPRSAPQKRGSMHNNCSMFGTDDAIGLVLDKDTNDWVSPSPNDHMLFTREASELVLVVDLKQNEGELLEYAAKTIAEHKAYYLAKKYAVNIGEENFNITGKGREGYPSMLRPSRRPYAREHR